MPRPTPSRSSKSSPTTWSAAMARRPAQLDEDLLFYLKARGIPAKEAEALLIQAFVGEAIEGDRARRHARTRSMRRPRAWLARARLTHASGGRERQPTTSTASAQDFPILAMQVYGKPLVYLDNAASAQKPKAVLDRMQQRLYARIRQRASRPALSRQCGDRRLRGRAREGRGLPQCARARKRSSSPATPPRRSISSPPRSAASASARATRSCSRSWSTIPTSCRGISCASARAR